MRMNMCRYIDLAFESKICSLWYPLSRSWKATDKYLENVYKNLSPYFVILECILLNFYSIWTLIQLRLEHCKIFNFCMWLVVIMVISWQWKFLLLIYGLLIYVLEHSLIRLCKIIVWNNKTQKKEKKKTVVPKPKNNRISKIKLLSKTCTNK